MKGSIFTLLTFITVDTIISIPPPFLLPRLPPLPIPLPPPPIIPPVVPGDSLPLIPVFGALASRGAKMAKDISSARPAPVSAPGLNETPSNNKSEAADNDLI